MSRKVGTCGGRWKKPAVARGVEWMRREEEAADAADEEEEEDAIEDAVLYANL